MQQRTKLLIWLSDLPTTVFGILSGVTIYFRAKAVEEEKLLAEFDFTRKPKLIEAKRAFRRALGTTIAAYAFLIIALSKLSAIF